MATTRRGSSQQQLSRKIVGTAKRKQTEFDRNEWFFVDVPESEVGACFCFEFARQIARQSPQVSPFLDQFKINRAAPWGTRESHKSLNAQLQVVKLMKACFPDALIAFDESFPEKPWQELPQEWRLGMTEHLTDELKQHRTLSHSDTFSISMERQLEPNERNIPMFRLLREFLAEKDFSQTEYGLLAINWKYSDTEIKAAFNKWLEAEHRNRGKRGFAKVNYRAKTGRGGPGDCLHALGALRLVERGLSDKELADYTKAKLGYRAYYNRVRELRDAAKRARELLDGLLTRLGN